MTAGLVVFGYRIRQGLASLKARRRARRWVAGEKRAAMLLERSGYRILDTQVATRLRVTWGDYDAELRLRADMLVERDGELLVAEVKTGNAPDIGNPATRRQLLEYLIAFPVDGVLLVDAETGALGRVDFHPQPLSVDTTERIRYRRQRAAMPWPAVVAGAWATAFVLMQL